VTDTTKTILIVDDNDDDVFALRRALNKAALENPQQIVTNGREAIDYLSGANRFSDRQSFPIPGLVFLDLKMPLVDGFEVLTWIREQAALRELPVIILTGSDEEKDHQRAAALGAHDYLVKPPSPGGLVQALGRLQNRAIN
jgi:CheY-like chemotaxis protein